MAPTPFDFGTPLIQPNDHLKAIRGKSTGPKTQILPHSDPIFSEMGSASSRSFCLPGLSMCGILEAWKRI